MKHSIDLIEDRRRHLIEMLREWISDSAIPRTRLAVMAGLSEMTLRRYDSPEWNPSLETLRKVEAFLVSAESRKTIRFREPVCKGDATERPDTEAA